MKRRIAYLLATLILLACGKDDSPKVPPAVSLVFPENNSECITGISRTETTSEVEFRWQAAQHAVRYELTVRHLGNNIVQNILATGLSASLVLDKGEAYSWTVVARNQSGQEGPAGPTWQFYNAGSELSYPPFPAQIKEPVSGETVTANQNSEVVLKWGGADADGDLSQFEVYFGTDASSLSLLDTVDAATGSYNVAVSSGTVYYWEILSRDAEGNTSRSGVFSFRVL